MLQHWRAGAAAVVITPDQPMWLAGFARRTHAAEGKATELYAKALALEDADRNRLVILTADLIAMPREIADWLSQQCAKQFGLRREQLLLATSHTHSGPEIRPSKALFFNIPDAYAVKIPAYIETLRQKMLQVIGESLANLSPARLYAGNGQATFAQNRRGAEEYIDHDVPVLRVDDLTGQVRGILFGYACHNTTLWEDSYVYCGDYAGFAQQYLQEKYPGAAAMFLCGAAADQNPEPRGSLENARSHGRELANAAASVQFKEITPRLSMAYAEVPLDFLPTPSPEELLALTQSADKPLARKALFLLDHPNPFEPTYPCPVQIIRLGHQVTLIAIAGEPVAEYAMNLKSELSSKSELIWVAGYANDMFGYVPTLRVQREGGYEGGRAMLWSALPAAWTETVEPRIMAAIRKMLGEESSHRRGADEHR